MCSELPLCDRDVLERATCRETYRRANHGIRTSRRISR